MGIKSKLFPHLTVFHNVDFVYNSQDAVQFSFIPQLEDEAQMFFNLRHGAVPKALSQELGFKAFHHGSRWKITGDTLGRNKNQVWSVNDKQVNKMIEVDKEFPFKSKYKTPQLKLPQPEESIPSPETRTPSQPSTHNDEYKKTRLQARYPQTPVLLDGPNWATFIDRTPPYHRHPLWRTKCTLKYPLK